MAFKSLAQERKFKEMLKEGKIKQSTFNEWAASTPKDLPERLGKPSKAGQAKNIKPIAPKKAK